MKKADYQMVGYIGISLGALLLLAGIFGATYYEIIEVSYIFWTKRFVVYPYAKYSGSLILSGTVLLVVGAAFLWRAKQNQQEKGNDLGREGKDNEM